MGEHEMVVIKGKERDIDAIAKGRFDLETDSKLGDEEKGAVRNCHAIGLCPILLIVQIPPPTSPHPIRIPF